MPAPLDKTAAPFLKRIEAVNEEIATIMSRAMLKVKDHREAIREIVAEAENKGVPKKALRGLVKWRKLERKQADIAESVEGDVDEAAAFDLLVEQLGPLGLAAITAEKTAKGGTKGGKGKRKPGKRAPIAEESDEALAEATAAFTNGIAEGAAVN